MNFTINLDIMKYPCKSYKYILFTGFGTHLCIGIFSKMALSFSDYACVYVHV